MQSRVIVSGEPLSSMTSPSASRSPTASTTTWTGRERWRSFPESGPAGTSAAMMVPVKDEGRVVGVVQLMSDRGRYSTSHPRSSKGWSRRWRRLFGTPDFSRSGGGWKRRGRGARRRDGARAGGQGRRRGRRRNLPRRPREGGSALEQGGRSDDGSEPRARARTAARRRHPRVEALPRASRLPRAARWRGR